MMCERVREEIPACLAGRLDKDERERLIGHLEMCSGCRNELAELGIVWRGLGNMEAPEPSRAMRARFQEMMDAYQAGMEQTPARTLAERRRGWSFGWHFAGWQLAAAGMVLFAVAAGGGYEAGAHRQTPTDMAQLKGQVDGLQQLVALSLLQAQSPSDRLRGVSYSSQMARPDQEVEASLLSAIAHDPNVEVRLSAVDAIEKYAGESAVRRALADEVDVQDSAIVQIRLIDLLLQARDRDAAPALRKLAADAQADAMVRERATLAMKKLEVTQ